MSISEKLGSEGIQYFNFLPDEMTLKIISYLPYDEIKDTIPLVCKDWKRLSEDDSLWEERVQYLISKFGKIEAQNQCRMHFNKKGEYCELSGGIIKKYQVSIAKKIKKLEEMQNQLDRLAGTNKTAIKACTII